MTSARLRQPSGWLVAVTAWLLSSPALHACPVCFQIEDGPVSAGVRAAVLLLVAVTTSVLCGAGLFVVRFARRASRLTEEDWR